MPLGIERINARRKQPNDRITFIKPLDGPDKAYAKDFLERIAAVCNPIMKEHHLSVMSLEEYEPNQEFVGRNFNAGEVIQLVLKAPFTGHWLPFKYVQMVMMHELAHCKQMNHSGAFWKVRNAYAGELKALWAKGYKGEGLWSRGVTLHSGQYEWNSLDDGEVLPEHLCGGTYRSSGKRKRKVKNILNYKEREERRIAKKFGANGTALGANEVTKVKLEKGKKRAAKPRVAGSVRGRELRAAAVLARYEIKAEELDTKNEEEEIESGTETDDSDAGSNDAVDINGKRMHDGQGRCLVKVCEDEKEEDDDAQNEKSELRSFDNGNESNEPRASRIERSGRIKDDPSIPKEPSAPARKVEGVKGASHSSATRSIASQARQEAPMDHTVFCPACSMENDPKASTCFVCANVLDIRGVPSTWRCQSDVCKGGKYINAGDCGVCGVCGALKCSNGI